MKSTTGDATQRDTQRDIDVSRVASNVASGVTITAASKQLGVTVRTVQRRLDSGVLRSIMRDGRRLVLLDSGATPSATQRDTLTRHATPNVASRDTSRDTAPGDMTTKYVAQIEAENRFLRGQIEEGNRNAAELRSALRKALDNAPKMLTNGTTTAPESPISGDNRGREGLGAAASNGTQDAPENEDEVDFDEIESLIYRAFK